MTTNEEGVSPVVGVMLMLVITIIIAAVISAFAGGLGVPSDRPPQVSMTATVHNNSTVYFDHMGGDGLNIDDLVILIDQGDRSLRFTNATLDRLDCNLFIKASGALLRPGDTLVLMGKENGSSTNFSTSSNSIAIDHDKEFTWTLLSKKSDSILTRGSLVFS